MWACRRPTLCALTPAPLPALLTSQPRPPQCTMSARCWTAPSSTPAATGASRSSLRWARARSSRVRLQAGEGTTAEVHGGGLRRRGPAVVCCVGRPGPGHRGRAWRGRCPGRWVSAWVVRGGQPRGARRRSPGPARAARPACPARSFHRAGWDKGVATMKRGEVRPAGGVGAGWLAGWLAAGAGRRRRCGPAGGTALPARGAGPQARGAPTAPALAPEPPRRCPSSPSPPTTGTARRAARPPSPAAPRWSLRWSCWSGRASRTSRVGGWAEGGPRRRGTLESWNNASACCSGRGAALRPGPPTLPIPYVPTLNPEPPKSQNPKKTLIPSVPTRRRRRRDQDGGGRGQRLGQAAGARRGLRQVSGARVWEGAWAGGSPRRALLASPGQHSCHSQRAVRPLSHAPTPLPGLCRFTARVQGAAQPFYTSPEEGEQFTLDQGHFCRALATGMRALAALGGGQAGGVRAAAPACPPAHHLLPRVTLNHHMRSYPAVCCQPQPPPR